MRFPSFALGGLLLATALPAHAQTTPAEAQATPRFYVGLAAYSSSYQPVGNQALGTGFRVPMQLTAGYQLRPRLAVQLGVAYRGGTSPYLSSTLYQDAITGPNTTYYTLEGDYTQRRTSVSVLARYTLTANPAHRLQFDALGGFGLEHRSIRSRGTQTNYAPGAATTVSDYEFGYAQNNLLLTGGIGARYRLSQHFELTYDLTLNKAFSGYGYDRGLTSSQALGLRYRFGR